jgi:hypothetical protein
MAYEIKGRKTEHAGAKKGKGAYYGRKRDAKKESNKERRRVDIIHAKREVLRVIEDTDDYDIILGIADHLFGEGWEDA